MKVCLLVIGMHRSGTSALTRGLSLGGAALPATLIESRVGNAAGHWESEPVAEFHEAFLARHDRSWSDFRPFHISAEAKADYRRAFAKIVEAEYGDAQVIVMKEPRLTRFAGLTISALEEMGYTVHPVHIVRHPREVCDSLEARDGMPVMQGALLWLRYVLSAARDLRGKEHRVTTYEALLRDAAGEVSAVLDDAGVSYDPGALGSSLAEFVSTSHRHHTHSDADTDIAGLGGWIGSVYRDLQQDAPRPPDAAARARLDMVRQGLDAATPALFDALETTSELRKTSEGIRAELEAAVAKVEQAEASRDRLANDIEEHTANIADEREAMAEQLAALAKDRDKLARDVEAQASDIATERESAASRVAALEAERSKLARDMETHTANIEVERVAFAAALETAEATASDQSALAASLTEEVRALHEERRDLEREQRLLRRERGELHDLLKETDSLMEARDAAHRRDVTELRQEMRQKLADAEARLAAGTADTVALETALRSEQALTARLHADMQALRNSTSWRLTRGLRRAVNLWRNRTLLPLLASGGSGSRGILLNRDVTEALDHSRSRRIRRAHADLAQSRKGVLEAPWLRAGQTMLPQDDLPDVTICAVLYNSEQWLWDFFVSVELLDYPMERITIHFVDNGSTDGTVGGVEAFISKNSHRYRSLKIFERPNLGYGAGNDYAIRQTDDDWVLVTNVDAEFYRSSLRRCLSVAVADDPDVACWEFRQAPYEHPKYYDPVTLETNWCAHACVLMRRSAYLSVGGYDTSIFMYGEDVELSYRFRAHGFRLRYVPGAVITHHVDLVDTSKRPHQLSGSVAANLLMRHRYGSARDVAAGEALLKALGRRELDPVRRDAFAEAERIVARNRRNFRTTHRPSRRVLAETAFPFVEFDYDIARPGGDVATEPYRAVDATLLPLVSVVTRTHGPSDAHLRNAIASVLNQTYPNIEHIVVEDRTENGRAIVEAAAREHGAERIRYMRSTGTGRSDCGNLGAEAARGEWICWLDNDDVLFADHIETLVRSLERGPDAPASYALAWDAHAVVDETLGALPTQLALPDAHRQPWSAERLRVENFIPIQSIIFRKSVFERFGGFNPDFSQLEDWNLWVRYSQAGEFVFTPRVTSIYYTPSDPGVRERRHQNLHEAYETVRQANEDDIVRIRKMNRPVSTEATASGRTASADTLSNV